LHHLDAQQLAVMLLALGLLIGCARLLGEMAQWLHQPAVLGELLAGVFLGPTVLGKLAPEWHVYLFPREGPNAVVLEGISHLAIVLFLLVAGLEVDLSLVWKQGRSSLRVAIASTLIPFLAGLACGWLMPTALGRQGDADPLIFALFLATAMAISALPVIAKILMDMNLYRTDLGMVVVSAAILNDLVGWTVFAVILGLMNPAAGGRAAISQTIGLTLLYAALMLTLGRWLIHRTLPLLQAYTHWPGGVLGFAVTLGLLGAAFTEAIGIHAIFGAFVAGVALGASRHLQERTRMLLDEFVSFIFAPIFFAGIGLRVDFLTQFDLPLVTLVLLLACACKLSGAVLGARWGGLSVRDQWAVGFAMNARGAMELILGLLALEAGVIRQRLFVALVVMALLTSLMGGPMIRLILRQRQPHRLLDYLSPKLFRRDLQAITRREAVQELSQMAAQAADLNADAVTEAVWAREKLVATGIGHQVALPHARLAGLKEPVVVVGLSEAGIEFDAPDGQLAHVVFLILTPKHDPAIQLELSASISEMFREPHAVERVLRAKGFTEFLAAMKTMTPRDR